MVETRSTRFKRNGKKSIKKSGHALKLCSEIACGYVTGKITADLMWARIYIYFKTNVSFRLKLIFEMVFKMEEKFHTFD